MSNTIIYGYIRQSSLEQVRFGYNLEEQERQIKDYCNYQFGENNYQLKIYIDAGRSGTNMNRPQLQQLLKDSKKEKPDAIVFHNIDRLSRELTDLWQMVKYFMSRDIKMMSVVGYIDLDTAYGKGNLLNEGLSAMIESMKISDRTIRALKEGVRQGKYPFSGCPKGYIKVEKKLYPGDEKEKEMIRYIYEYVSENRGSVVELRKYINDTYSQKLTDESLKRLVGNRIYTGVMDYKGILIDDYCEALIDKEIYDLANKNIKRKKYSHKKTPYYFRNLVYCCNDNRYMFQTSGTGKSGKVYAYYRCPCCKKAISQKAIVEASKVSLDEITEHYCRNQSGAEDLIKKIDSLIAKQRELVRRQKETPIKTDDFFEIYEKYDSQIELFDRQLREMKYQIKHFDTLSDDSKMALREYIKRIDVIYKKGTKKIIFFKKSKKMY